MSESITTAKDKLDPQEGPETGQARQAATPRDGREGRADIGVTGLAVMGANLARNFARNGYTVALHNRSRARTDDLVAQFSEEGDFIPTETLTELVANLATPRRVLVMVKAGQPVDDVIEQLIPLLEAGDIVIDAGNSHYEDTRRREAALAEQGLHFVGVGVSGGEEGALNGPAIMPGGPKESYQALGPLLESIAADYDGDPCCAWIGTDGAGHFVKMVHNGIEYADMQVIGEAYDLLRRVGGYEPAEQATIFDQWNRTELASYLIEITSDVLPGGRGDPAPAGGPDRGRGRAEGHRALDGDLRPGPGLPDRRDRRVRVRPVPLQPDRRA